MMRLGSLFDGSGTAPLAASMCGIDPIWASEIEPYPIAVTKARFPQMQHLGSILDVDGSKVVPVDIICGGSPCQDLSVAGKQAGIHNGERSHLFFEMTRIIKEMRGATNGKYPRYIIWENVPGAFSSNKGEDFLAVLQAFAEIADPNIHVPKPESKGGRLAWKYAGEVVGDGWSIAWRTVDAQYWGVPQRRRRIYLVADLGSECAGEILFEREGVSRDSEPSGAQGQTASGDAGRGFVGSGEHERRGVVSDVVFALQANGIDRADTACCNGSGWRENESYTLNTVDRHAVCFAPNGNHCGVFDESHVGATLQTKYHYGSGGDSALAVFDARGNGNGETVPTLTGDHQNRVTDYTALAVGNEQMQNITMAEVGNTLDCMHDQQAVLYNGKPPRKYTVRRLTPLECCRLQGFPDYWMDGVDGSDSAKYKMWGNGMALPNMLFVMRRIAEMEVAV